MSRTCAITGKKPQTGNRVSHSNRKTKHRFLPNIQKKRIWDTENQCFVKLKLSTQAIRLIEKVGLRAALEKYLT